MWNSTHQTPSQYEIVTQHLKTLEIAVLRAEEFDICTAEIYSTLDYLQNKSTRSWGFTLFKEGLENCDLLTLKASLKLIKQHLGRE